jgi:hypothetical protein
VVDGLQDVVEVAPRDVEVRGGFRDLGTRQRPELAGLHENAVARDGRQVLHVRLVHVELARVIAAAFVSE